MNAGSKAAKTEKTTNRSKGPDFTVLNANKNTERESSLLFRSAENGFFNNFFMIKTLVITMDLQSADQFCCHLEQLFAANIVTCIEVIKDTILFK